MKAVWLGKGAMGDAFTIAWSMDFLRRWMNLTEVVVVGSPAVLSVARELAFVTGAYPIPAKANLPAWAVLLASLKKHRPGLVTVQGKGGGLAWLAKGLNPEWLADWPRQTFQRRGAPPVALADVLLKPGDLLARLGAPTPAVDPALNPLPPLRHPPPHAPRQGVVLAPFTSAAWPSKAWPVEHYLVLARRLLDRGSPVTVIAAAGEAQGLPPFQALGAATQAGLSIRDMAHLFHRSQASVSGDSMAAHAAPLFGARPVILLGPTTERYVSRYINLPSPIILKREDLDCLGCHQKRCPLPEPAFHACLTGLSVEQVAAGLDPLLAESSP